jgi:hypothetical protein
MGGTELVQIAEALGGVPLAVLLILVLIGGYKGWWVYGRELTAERERSAALLEAAAKREQEWREIALSGRELAQNAVDFAKSTKR